ncbi:putative aminotransferase [Cardiosporidium cionae]|uniref:Aminotransferase n=1 Tax=Cardiosporidium cionae TaxID=476202 RepID=A0ABQ7JAZ9_9APIC|nr:putative aminotransferase [Cardiosporidium cionae]|eukprot:KAF8821173.1 putative aminotransferase [Cardiosporidium cionae]
MPSSNYTQARCPPASELVDLRLGYPELNVNRIDFIREAAHAQFNENDPTFYLYGQNRGYREFREDLAKFLTTNYGFYVDTDELMIVNGSAGGLDLICRMLTTPGDVIFTEDPTYFLAEGTFRDYHLKTVQIPMYADGVDMVEFERLLTIHKPKLFYTIPVGHNPTGRTTSQKKREELAVLALRHDFFIVADEVYQLLTFPGNEETASILVVLLLASVLDVKLPDFEYEIPLGGYFLIAKVPPDLDVPELWQIANRFGVNFLPGSEFGKAFPNYIRLSFSFYTADEIEEGISRLKAAVEECRQSPKALLIA